MGCVAWPCHDSDEPIYALMCSILICWIWTDRCSISSNLLKSCLWLNVAQNNWFLITSIFHKMTIFGYTNKLFQTLTPLWSPWHPLRHELFPPTSYQITTYHIPKFCEDIWVGTKSILLAVPLLPSGVVTELLKNRTFSMGKSTINRHFQ